MNKFSYILLFAALIYAPLLVRAEGEAVRGAGERSYRLYLYYDAGAVSMDQAFSFPYDIITEPYEVAPTPRIHKGEVRGFNDELLAEFSFDPRFNNEAFTRGPITAKAPYYPNASQIIIHGRDGTVALTISVNRTAICNEDQRCNWGGGEDAENCPSDCRGSVIPSPVPVNLPSALPNAEEAGGGFWSFGTILAVIGILAVLATFVYVRSRRA